MKSNGMEQVQVNGRGPFGIRIKRSEHQAGHGESDIARKMEHSISYMLQHLDQPLHVATLAAVVNVSPSHYSALFKRWTGCPPIDYFIHLRMQQACRLFDHTSLKVKEVAAALGYDDPFYFSRTFKSVHHVSPSEYRSMPEKLKGAVKSAVLSCHAFVQMTHREVPGPSDDFRAFPMGSPPGRKGALSPFSVSYRTEAEEGKEPVGPEKPGFVHSTR
jgi:AraC-like DNA-binding protein